MFFSERPSFPLVVWWCKVAVATSSIVERSIVHERSPWTKAWPPSSRAIYRIFTEVSAHRLCSFSMMNSNDGWSSLDNNRPKNENPHFLLEENKEWCSSCRSLQLSWSFSNLSLLSRPFTSTWFDLKFLPLLHHRITVKRRSSSPLGIFAFVEHNTFFSVK